MVLAVIIAVPENVWDECYCTYSSYLYKFYCGYQLVTAVHSDYILHSLIVFSEYVGIRHEVKRSIIMHFINNNKNVMYFRGKYIDHIYTPKGRNLLHRI